VQALAELDSGGTCFRVVLGRLVAERPAVFLRACLRIRIPAGFARVLPVQCLAGRRGGLRFRVAAEGPDASAVGRIEEVVVFLHLVTRIVEHRLGDVLGVRQSQVMTNLVSEHADRMAAHAVVRRLADDSMRPVVFPRRNVVRGLRVLVVRKGRSAIGRRHRRPNEYRNRRVGHPVGDCSEPAAGVRLLVRGEGTGGQHRINVLRIRYDIGPSVRRRGWLVPQGKLNGAQYVGVDSPDFFDLELHTRRPPGRVRPRHSPEYRFILQRVRHPRWSKDDEAQRNVSLREGFRKGFRRSAKCFLSFLDRHARATCQHHRHDRDRGRDELK